MGIEIENALIIEDLDPKNSLRCRISEETTQEMF
jgi:hypothetical protein